MVVEVLQMYNAQQEKLQSTLRKQQQLEKVLTPHVRHVSIMRRAELKFNYFRDDAKEKY